MEPVLDLAAFADQSNSNWLTHEEQISVAPGETFSIILGE